MRPALAATAAIALIALAGCGRMGNPIEIVTSKPPAPDEFQVIARAPLQMPASLRLPEPRPGTPSPLEPDPNRDAVVALMGSETRLAAAGAGPGEQALLAAADAAGGDPAIRRTLESDRASADAAYEVPTLWELFGGGDRPPEDVIDPAAEARRLQSAGVAATPVDPNARPELEEEEQVEEPSPYPEIGVGGPPRNKLPSSRTTPAY